MPHSEAPSRSVLLLGPSLAAISGVSTHLNLLFSSELARRHRLRHFQVGSEGRRESRLRRCGRLVFGPWALAARLLAGRIDIVHINTSLNPQAYWRDLSFLLVSRLLGRHVVWQIHGGPTPRVYCAGRPLLRRLLRLTLRLPDVVVVLASAELEAYRRFLPGQDVQHLPNAIDLAPYAALPPRPPRPPDAPLHLAYLGRVARPKGVFEAVEAVRQARAQGLAVCLTVAGDGPDRTALETIGQDLLEEGSLKFLGATFGEDKMRLLAAADVLLLPSYSEGLPYALLEAMAAGLPAITTAVGAIPDVILDGQHGLLIPPRDSGAIVRAIARLAAHPERLAEMAADCRRRVGANYALPRLASQFARLYGGLGRSVRPANIAVRS